MAPDLRSGKKYPSTEDNTVLRSGKKYSLTDGKTTARSGKKLPSTEGKTTLKRLDFSTGPVVSNSKLSNQKDQRLADSSVKTTLTSTPSGSDTVQATVDSNDGLTPSPQETPSKGRPKRGRPQRVQSPDPLATHYQSMMHPRHSDHQYSPSVLHQSTPQVSGAWPNPEANTAPLPDHGSQAQANLADQQEKHRVQVRKMPLGMVLIITLIVSILAALVFKGPEILPPSLWSASRASPPEGDRGNSQGRKVLANGMNNNGDGLAVVELGGGDWM